MVRFWTLGFIDLEKESLAIFLEECPTFHIHYELLTVFVLNSINRYDETMARKSTSQDERKVDSSRNVASNEQGNFFLTTRNKVCLFDFFFQSWIKDRYRITIG